jgi:hypothetical protein
MNDDDAMSEAMKEDEDHTPAGVLLHPDEFWRNRMRPCPWCLLVMPHRHLCHHNNEQTEA